MTDVPSPFGGGGLRRGHHLSVWLIVALSVACTTSAPSVRGPGPTGPTAPAARRVILSVSPPGSESNTARLNVQGDAWQLRPIYEHLIGIDATNGKFVPMLASEWSLEPDGM